MHLPGRTALVTGSTTGIGQAIAEAFAREGARVGVTSRNDQRGQAVVDPIRMAGGQATFIDADQASVEGARRLAREATVILGRIDILVNKVGIFPFASTSETDEATLLASTLPARRVAEPSEIAGAAVFLASDEASFVHGAVLPVDGGRPAV